jgi:hypothetical protein
LRELNIDIDIAERQLHTLETQHRAQAAELAPNQSDLEALLKEKPTVDEHNAVSDYLDEQRRQIDEAVETICREFRRLREISTDAAYDRKWDSLKNDANRRLLRDVGKPNGFQYELVKFVEIRLLEQTLERPCA